MQQDTGTGYGYGYAPDYTNWLDIKRNRPELADRILKEYQKRNGFVPYEQGYVYLMRACGTNYYKIGKSVNPDRRLLQIAPQMPFTTVFVKVWRSNFMSMGEKLLHHFFQDYRANGEWFKLPEHALDQLFSGWLLEDIRDAYGVAFFEKTTGVETHDHLEATKFHTSTLDSLGWVESIFRQISEEESPINKDAIAEYIALKEQDEAEAKARADRKAQEQLERDREILEAFYESEDWGEDREVFRRRYSLNRVDWAKFCLRMGLICGDEP